eukprot:snap_masked-scaffold_6-processed-gene-4.36-mRNA-1 protein AED:1.00 eAED:1.00 QI:0/-1/0/0/-1/1/1/0/567
MRNLLTRRATEPLKALLYPFNQQNIRTFTNLSIAKKKEKLSFSKEFFSHKTKKYNLPCGNVVQQLHDGKEIFPEIVRSLQMAKKEILIEMYWFADDKAGQKVSEELIAAKKRGVDVNLIYDSFGSSSFSKKLKSTLTAEGVNLYEYNPIKIIGRDRLTLFSYFLTKFLRRDHRKVIVVDRKVSILGGSNVGNEWLPLEEGGDNWRDVMLKISGPAAKVSAEIYLRFCNVLKENETDFNYSMYFKLKRMLQYTSFNHLWRKKYESESNSDRFTRVFRGYLARLRDRVENMGYGPSSGQLLYLLRKDLNISSSKAFEYEETFANSYDLQPHFMNSTGLEEEICPVSYAWWSSQGKIQTKYGFNTFPPNSYLVQRTTETYENKSIPSNVQLLTNDAWNSRRIIRRGYLRAIHAARKKILISNGYFLPDSAILNALKKASRRGVEIKLVLAEKSDVWFYKHLAGSKYEQMLKNGIKVYEYQPSVLHSKVASFDNSVAVIGSYNLDPLSYKRNIEMVSVVHNREFSLDLEKRLEKDISAHCKDMSIEWKPPPLPRLAEAILNRMYDYYVKIV